MLGHEFTEKARDHDHATAVGLRGAEVEGSPDLGQRLNHLDLGPKELASLAPDGDGRAPPLAAVGEERDKSPVGLMDRRSQALHVLAIDEQHFGYWLTRQLDSRHRIGN